MTALESIRPATRPVDRPTALNPVHLTAWVADKTLGQEVLKAVQAVDTGELRPVAALDAGVAMQPVNLLAAITYCYAVGVYGSQEIEDMMRRDVTFRRRSNGEFPRWKAIRRFRRHNAAILHRTLTETFRALRGLNQQTRPSEPGTRLNNPAVSRIGCKASADTDRFSQEAWDRIEQAMWLDQMAMDEDDLA